MARPLKFDNPTVFTEKVEQFFIMCEEKKLFPTIERLADYLDCDSDTIRRYEERASDDLREDKSKFYEFCVAIKKARQKCAVALTDKILSSPNPAGAIFLAKNNLGYKDKQEIEANVKGELVINISLQSESEE